MDGCFRGAQRASPGRSQPWCQKLRFCGRRTGATSARAVNNCRDKLTPAGTSRPLRICGEVMDEIAEWLFATAAGFARWSVMSSGRGMKTTGLPL